MMQPMFPYAQCPPQPGWAPPQLPGNAAQPPEHQRPRMQDDAEEQLAERLNRLEERVSKISSSNRQVQRQLEKRERSPEPLRARADESEEDDAGTAADDAVRALQSAADRLEQLAGGLPPLQEDSREEDLDELSAAGDRLTSMAAQCELLASDLSKVLECPPETQSSAAAAKEEEAPPASADLVVAPLASQQSSGLEEIDAIIAETQHNLALYGKVLDGDDAGAEVVEGSVLESQQNSRASSSPSLASLLHSRSKANHGTGAREETSIVLAAIISSLENLATMGLRPGEPVAGSSRVGGGQRRWKALSQELQRLRSEEDLERERLKNLRHEQAAVLQATERSLSELDRRVEEAISAPDASACSLLLLEQLESLEKQKQELEAQLSKLALQLEEGKKGYKEDKARSEAATKLYADAEEAADSSEQVEHTGSTHRAAVLGRVNDAVQSQLAQELALCAELEARLAACGSQPWPDG